ncbi:hypothetical protein FPT12_20515 [Pseudomonas sp. H3(2019)]|nr:hypothetical protein FPT12_20515 [Pseudomonas sp. H3(2019)]
MKGQVHLLERTNFGGKVYRTDLREPEEILREGFNPTGDFTAISNMLNNPSRNHGRDALVVAETLEGAIFYATQGSLDPYFYEIDASDVGGVSLLENLVLNKEGMLAHLEVGPDGSLSDQTGLANRMHEAHLSFDDLKLQGRPIVPLGRLTKEVEHMRHIMNL